MSIPTKYAEHCLDNLTQGLVKNLIAQVDARRILQETNETPDNFPIFDPALTEKTTYIAYYLISCGCSILENRDSSKDLGIETLEKAGKILSDSYSFNQNELENQKFNLLIAGMSLYAAKQYSRAFIVLKGVDSDFVVGQIIISFIKKDFNALINFTNKTFFSTVSEQIDILGFDEWVISHEIARCFLIIIDYIYAGNEEDFVLVNDILEKLLCLSSNDKLTLYWLIIRLLKIILATFHDASLWPTLLPLFPEKVITSKYIRLLSSFKSPVIELWPSQKASLPFAVGDNNGAVVNLRTSGGKTRVAEIAILEVLSRYNTSKILYLAPFRSLAFEIEQSLNKTFAPLGVTVSQLYGGSTANVTDLELIKQSQIIIATPEKAKAIIRSGMGIEEQIKLIVIDEGHLLGAEERYIRNEMFITHIKEYALRNEIRVLLLSAVLPNADDLAKWIAGDSALVAKSDWKPSLERLGFLLWDGTRVKLQWKSEGEPYNPNFIQKAPLGFGGRRNPFPNNKNEAVAATAVRLAQNGTVMIYSARATSINGLAESVLLALGEDPEDFQWDTFIWAVFESVCAEELNEKDIILLAARKGVICHCDRLPPLVRIAMERLMRSKPPLIIIASSTLAQGVNVGISAIIVSTPYYSKEYISSRDFWNICGRAGRAFSDTEGKILYSIDTSIKENVREQWQVDKDYKLGLSYFDNNKMERVESGLRILLKLIFNIAKKTHTDFNMLVEAIANDFNETKIPNEFLNDLDLSELNSLFDYIDDELLAMHEDFAADDLNLSWVEDVFNKSLMVIQVEAKEKEHYLKLLLARTNALLNRVKSKADRKRIVASGITFAVSKSILNNIDLFRNLAMQFIQQLVDKCNEVEALDKMIRELEIWSNQNADDLIQIMPSQSVLDNVRQKWISGVSLSEIRIAGREVDNITKNYYGFTLPWIIHAISQMFDSESEKEIVQVYSNIAMFIELGLPNETASNIYMAGIHSRITALELSKFDVFQGKTITEVKKILLDFSPHTTYLSKDAQVWIDLLLKTFKAQKPKKISFPNFTWERKSLPQKLYLREQNGLYYLVSCDGYFQEQVDSSEDLPFADIANIHGLFFALNQGEWQLQSYNPFIQIK